MATPVFAPPLVMLDRDGVLNLDKSPMGVLDDAAFVFYPGALAALRLFRKRGVQVAVATNQSAIGKGRLTHAGLGVIHSRMLARIRAAGGDIAYITYCSDPPEFPSYRRKPGAGMLQEILAYFRARPEDTPYIGDSLRDLEAARRLGCPRHLVRTGHGARSATQVTPLLEPVTMHEDLLAAARWLLQHHPAFAADA